MKVKDKKIVAQQLLSVLKSTARKEVAAWQVLADIKETHQRFEKLNKERLEIYNKLKRKKIVSYHQPKRSIIQMQTTILSALDDMRRGEVLCRQTKRNIYTG